jgi:hypothetical protein
MSAKAVVITERTFKCAKGHVWRGTKPFSFTALDGAGGNCTSSGPLCPTCIADLLRLNFGMVEVAEEKPNAES